MKDRGRSSCGGTLTAMIVSNNRLRVQQQVTSPDGVLAAETGAVRGLGVAEGVEG